MFCVLRRTVEGEKEKCEPLPQVVVVRFRLHTLGLRSNTSSVYHLGPSCY